MCIIHGMGWKYHLVKYTLNSQFHKNSFRKPGVWEHNIFNQVSLSNKAKEQISRATLTQSQ